MSERSIYRAKTLVSMDGPPIDDGAVAIEGEKIVAAGRFSDVQTEGGRVHDLGEMVLLPGLINAHCHLDYTALRGMIAPQRSFADWILQINLDGVIRNVPVPSGGCVGEALTYRGSFLSDRRR